MPRTRSGPWPQVAGRRRLAIGAHRNQAPLPGVAQAGDQALHDRVTAIEPERVRRHRDPCVLAKHRGRGLDVRTLVGIDEPLEQVALLGGRLRGRWLGPPMRRVRAASWPAPAAARCSGSHAHSSWEAVSAAEKSSTSRRISTARWRGGRSWMAARYASSIVSRRTATASGWASRGPASSSRRSGIWLQPRHLAERAQRPA